MEPVQFASGEEAWLWHIACEEHMRKPKSSWPSYLTSTLRPCEPHEIFTEICRAFRAQVLTKRHLEVLNRSTMRGSHSLTKRDIEYFEGAMAVLTARLRSKQIVA